MWCILFKDINDNTWKVVQSVGVINTYSSRDDALTYAKTLNLSPNLFLIKQDEAFTTNYEWVIP